MKHDALAPLAHASTLLAEPRWPPTRWAWALWALLAATAALPMGALHGDPDVFAEGAMAESLQAGMLLVGALASIHVAGRLRDRRCRNATLMLGALAALALARELDLHILMNPQHLGPWGVRYRSDWWLGGEAGLGVRALWLGIFTLVGGVLALLAIRAAGPIDWRRARPRLMVLTGAMYALGFACDDLFRGVGNEDLRQALEESAELLAPAFLLGAILGPESAGPTGRPNAAARAA